MHGKTAHPDGMINKCIHQYETFGSMLYIKQKHLVSKIRE